MAQDEIERRFLVDATKLNLEGRYHYEIVQGYLDTDPASHVTRVRLVDAVGSKSAYLTLKTRKEKGIHREFEYEIPGEDAEELLQCCGSLIVKKTRHLLQFGMETPLVHIPIWEIDVFKGALEGLIIAECELPSLDFELELPDFIVMEVTGISELSNYQLAKNPDAAKALVATLLENKL